MSNIIAFERNDPHLSGEAICACCRHKWIAVAPVGTKELECPECGTFKGLFVNQVAPRSEYLWECNCGCQIFFILKEGIQCYQCGDIQSFP